MTGFVKTMPNGTTIGIKFIADYQTYTLALPRNTKCITTDGQVWFLRWLIPNPVKPPRYTTGSVGPVNGFNKDVRGVSLLPMNVSKYLVD